jgi:ankyrin repeat protein
MRNETGFNHLLEMGADPNVVFGDGGSVMHWAARKSDCSMLEAALKHGGNPNLKAGMYGGSPLFETITVGNNKGIPECLKLLLQSGADINLQDDKGQTILLMAADLARFDIVLYLLQQGADITAVDKKNQNIKSLHHSYEGAFKKGSVTEKYWFRVKNWLDTKKGKE